MNPIENVRLLSGISLIITWIGIRYLSNAKTLDAYWFGSLFVATPLIVFGTVQKILYPADIISGVFIIRFILRSLDKRQSLNDVLVDWLDALAFFLLVASPILANTLQIVFDKGSAVDYMMLTLYRGIGAFALFYMFRRVFEAKTSEMEGVVTGAVVALSCAGVAAVLHFLKIFPTDLLEIIGETSSITDWTGGFGGGVIGMYRGEYGAYSAICIAFLLPRVIDRPIPRLLLLGSILSSVYGVLSVGSRQGLVAIGIALFLFSVISLIYRGSGKLVWILAPLCVAAIFGLGITLSADPEFAAWVFDRFEIFTTSTSTIVYEASTRDIRSTAILSEVYSNFFRYILGVGYGGFNEFPVADSWRITYVDSEVLWVLQQNGLLGVAAYLALLGAWGSLAWKTVCVESFRLRGASSFVTLVVCLFLLYGHYVFLNWHSAHASIAYIHWLLLAMIATESREIFCTKNNTFSLTQALSHVKVVR